MPHIPGLLRLRSGQYRLNVRIPKDILAHFPSDYPKNGIKRVSLHTSDWRVAVDQVRAQQHELQVEFTEKKRLLSDQEPMHGARCRSADLTDTEVYGLVSRWFYEMESDHQKWWNSEGVALKKTGVDLTLAIDAARRITLPLRSRVTTNSAFHPQLLYPQKSFSGLIRWIASCKRSTASDESAR